MSGLLIINTDTFLSALSRLKPVGRTVSISFLGNKLKIEGLTAPCKWAPVPDWIGQMSAEALFHSEKASIQDQSLLCPKCGKKQGVEVNTAPYTQLELEPATQINIPPNRRCKSCNHCWIEISQG